MSKSKLPPDWPFIRGRVLQRDNLECQECGVEVGERSDGNTADAEVHHVVPRSEGGSHDMDNLQTLCSYCHRGIGKAESDDLRPADEEILDVLAEGRNNAPNIADESGLSKQYIRERLGRLRDEEFVETIGSGIYELVNDPREES